jgi:ComF family protein
VQRLLSTDCLLCAGAAPGELICKPRAADLPRLDATRCSICALPITEGQRNGACISQPPNYDHVCAGFAYAFPADALIRALKYRGILAAPPFLGETIAGSLDETPDVLIAMPLAAARLRERGFNQAHEIARRAARAVNVPLDAQACRKVRDTPPKAALPWKKRAKNLRRAFVCEADFTGKHVALVNDVMTTGATLNEIARNPKQAGATHATGLVAARTLPGAHHKKAQDV